MKKGMESKQALSAYQGCFLCKNRPLILFQNERSCETGQKWNVHE